MPQRTLPKYFKHAVAVFGLLAAIAGSIPLWHWLDSQVVSAEEFQREAEKITRGLRSVTEANLEAIQANTLQDLDTRIMVIEDQIRGTSWTTS